MGTRYRYFTPDGGPPNKGAPPDAPKNPRGFGPYGGIKPPAAPSGPSLFCYGGLGMTPFGCLAFPPPPPPPPPSGPPPPYLCGPIPGPGPTPFVVTPQPAPAPAP